MRILLIEEDPMIGKAMWQGLVDASFTVDWVMDGRTADASLESGVYDLAILDLGLPRKDGMEVLLTLRSRGNGVPVLIVEGVDRVMTRQEIEQAVYRPGEEIESNALEVHGARTAA